MLQITTAANLRETVEQAGHRLTGARRMLLQAIADRSEGFAAEELATRLPSVGRATVYRTLKLLVEAGIAQERHFGDGLARYEVEHEHHDHLVCLSCDKIVEFECSMIEARQEEIATGYHFKLLRHRHELYGQCESCQSAVDA